MKINIILSTYNGSTYLAEQLDSILAQSWLDWVLWVRDDGSIDNTRDILNEYAVRDNRIHILANDNLSLGAKDSFAALLEQQKGVDYVMFCDQDDVWLPSKVQITLEAMVSMEAQHGRIPILVHSDLYVADTSLNLISKSFWKYQLINPKYKNLNQILVSNNVTACTAMLNKALINLVIPIPKMAIMHDWWFALVASAFGEIAYINEPLIYYRQHGNNNVGARKFNSSYILNKISNTIKADDLRENTILSVAQANSFKLSYYNQLDSHSLKIVEVYANLMNLDFLEKRLTVFKHSFFKSGLARNLGFLLSI
jgi:glycosyltransferase involved in cell wall biosynthesis